MILTTLTVWSIAFIKVMSDHFLKDIILLYINAEKWISNTNNVQCICITELNVQQLGGLLDKG